MPDDQQVLPPAQPSPFNAGEDVLGSQVSLGQPTKKERFIWGAGWYVTEEFICHLDNRDLLTPQILSPHPTRTKSYLREVYPDQHANSPLCKVRLEYIPDPDEFDGGDGPNSPADRCPPNTVTEDGSTVEQDIRLHPDFAAQMSAFWDWRNSKFHDEPNLLNRFTGVEAYLVGSILITSTIYSSTEPADIEADLGTLADPPGKVSAAGLSNYLIVSGQKSKEGECWARSLAYQYNKHGWDDIIYS